MTRSSDRRPRAPDPRSVVLCLRLACLRLAVLPVASLISVGCGGAGEGPLIVIEVETRENTLDGCTACGCRTRGEIEPAEVGTWWMSFGHAASAEASGWRAIGSTSRCGVGSFEGIRSGLEETSGPAYAIVDLTTAADSSGEERTLDVRARIRRLVRFDAAGEPEYAERLERRSLVLEPGSAITLPMLIADPRERESFGVHEVLFRIRASVLPRAEASRYGSVAVRADVPAARIFVDGGVVGRVPEGRAAILDNIVAGRREIRVRDLSGREATAEALVEPGGRAEVTLDVLGLPPDHAAGDLLPLGRNPEGHEEFLRVRDAATVVRIPEGSFLMGSPEGVGAADERPQHRVYLSEFWIDKTEVTWRQFRKFAAAGGAAIPREPIWGSPDDHPVAFAVWEDARSYCEWVGGRLPTEAEWEKAARGESGWKYSWGDAWDARRCNSISGGLHAPEAVGSHPRCSSPYGVLDMPGSMWEWCSDFYGEGYYAESPERDPDGPASGSLRVMRGGDWMSQSDWLRAAYRAKRSPASRNLNHGFRCVLDATGSSR